jgi:hypothetical protein
MKIVKPDPFTPYYAFEKRKNPEQKLWWMAARRRDVESIDRLVELSHGRDRVETRTDWDALGEVLKFYVTRWPQEFLEFRQVVPQIRDSRRTGGYTTNKEMKYLASLPPRLERLIKYTFPAQQFDKKFVYKFISKYKVFRVGE